MWLDGKLTWRELDEERDKLRGAVPCPAFATSRKHDEWWPAVLEKAYAKYYGSFAAIEGGWVDEALCNFIPSSTGLHISLGSSAVKAEIASGALWKRLQRYTALGDLLGAGSPSGRDTNTSEQGIVFGHAYSVLRLYDEGETRLVQLRNPHGQTEWKGKWSDGDKETWKGSYWRNRLGYDPDASGDDGTFWMSWEDFSTHYANIYVCRILRAVADGGPWHKSTIEGEWRGPTAGGWFLDRATWKRNPQFSLALTTTTTVVITLAQMGTGDRGGPRARSMAFHVLDLGGCRAAGVVNKVKDSGAYDPAAEVTAEGELRPSETGGKPLTIVPSTFEAGVELRFLLTVYSDKPLGAPLTLLPADWPEKGK
jgi:hypothetical protein